MILLFELLSKIEKKLNVLLEQGAIGDYKVTLRVNNKGLIFILLEDDLKKGIVEAQLSLFKHKNIEFDFLLKQEVENDSYYTEIFSTEKKIFLDSRKKLSNLLELDKYQGINVKSKIATFYSYKGGVGRSTSLASCAAYLSNHFDKKILIIDCDFEAPGFTNYYLEEPSQVNNHPGVIEYFMDLDYDGDKIDITNYIWEVGKNFSGSGSIMVMSAGNLSDEPIEGDNIFGSHKNHYLEGLARVDTSSSFTLGKKFSTLLTEADKGLQPDIILIDSRTGFNDIFGITALNISDMVVGLFGNNVQNLPGLNFFIDRIIESKTGLNAILLNAIIPRRSAFVKFESYVENYIQRQSSDEDAVVIRTYPVTRYDVLEMIGTSDERKEDFIDLIKNKRFPDYNEVFIYINEVLESDSEIEDKSDNSISEEDNENVSKKAEERPLSYSEKVKRLTKEILSLDLKDAYTKIQENDKYAQSIQKEIKKIIVNKIEISWPKLYAENATDEMIKNIFYRRSMEDIFNSSKLIILGNKGTGKTFLYEALKRPAIVERIQERAQKKGNYEVFHAIDPAAGKFIDAGVFADNADENFYHRFWVVYIWNAIMLDSENRLGYTSSLDVLPIMNKTKTKLRFIELINDDEKFVQVEDDLENLDSYLKSSQNNLKLIVIFDGLDQIVKPINWHYKIVPLISFWRNHSFSRIAPKLFIRSDLFEKLSNITNVKELKNRSISIEWSQDEVFGYFFKLVLSASKDEFLKYLSFTRLNSYELIKQIRQKSPKDGQLPLEQYYIKPLVIAFFGKYASADNTPRFGESYDWFYRNLKNANNTISLRPFIDLISNAMEYAKTNDSYSYPILPATFYVHGEARKTALGNHFSDLVSEQGNENLKVICSYIREKKSSQTIYLEIGKNAMLQLLNEVIETYKLKDTSVDELIYLLKVNGIINEHFKSGGISYSFALLYKYYLGLKNKPKAGGRR